MSISAEAPACPRCHSAGTLLLCAHDRNRRMSDERFPYYRCDCCGLIYLSPIPADLGRYYPSDYYARPPTLQELEQQAAHEHYKLNAVRAFAAGQRLVEIGPSYGSFVYAAQRVGFSVSAIEMDAACCAFLEARLGVTALNSATPAVALYRLPRQDVIALWHVLEHLPDPWQLLAVAAAQLRTGGIIAIAMPNPGSLQFRILRSRWAHVDAPRHVLLVPQALLVQHMALLGMRPVLLTSDDQGSRGWNRFGWQHSLMNMVSGAPARRIARVGGRALGVMAAPFERLPGLGSTYTAVFQKA